MFFHFHSSACGSERERELILWTTDKVCWDSYKHMAVRPLFKAQLEGYMIVSMVYL